MRCDAFQQRLQEVLDERGDVHRETELRAHAQRCDACRRDLRALAHMQSAVLQVRGTARRGRVKQLLGVSVMATALLLAFRGERAPTPNDRGVPPQAVASAPRNHVPPSAEFHPLQPPIMSLQLLRTGDWSETLAGVDMPFAAELPEVETQWVSAVAEGFSPLSDSLVTTLDLIRRSVTPGANEPIRS